MWQQIQSDIQANIQRIAQTNTLQGPSTANAKLSDPRIEPIQTISQIRKTAKVSYVVAEILGPVREASSSTAADVLVLARQPYDGGGDDGDDALTRAAQNNRSDLLYHPSQQKGSTSSVTNVPAILLAIHSEVLLMCPAAASKGTCLLLQDITVLQPNTSTRGLVCGIVCQRNLLGLYEREAGSAIGLDVSGHSHSLLHNSPYTDAGHDSPSTGFAAAAVPTNSCLSDSILMPSAPQPSISPIRPEIAPIPQAPQQVPQGVPSLSTMLQSLAGLVKGGAATGAAKNNEPFQPAAPATPLLSQPQRTMISSSTRSPVDNGPSNYPVSGSTSASVELFGAPPVQSTGGQLPSANVLEHSKGATKQQATLVGLFAKKKAAALAASVSRASSEVPHSSAASSTPQQAVVASQSLAQPQAVDREVSTHNQPVLTGSSKSGALSVDDEEELFPDKGRSSLSPSHFQTTLMLSGATSSTVLDPTTTKPHIFESTYDARAPHLRSETVEVEEFQPPPKLARTETLPPPVPQIPVPPNPPSLPSQSMADFAQMFSKITSPNSDRPTDVFTPTTKNNATPIAPSVPTEAPPRITSPLASIQTFVPIGPTISTPTTYASTVQAESKSSAPLASEITKAPQMRRFKPPAQKAAPAPAPETVSRPEVFANEPPPPPPALPLQQSYGSSFLAGRGITTTTPIMARPQEPTPFSSQSEANYTFKAPPPMSAASSTTEANFGAPLGRLIPSAPQLRMDPTSLEALFGGHSSTASATSSNAVNPSNHGNNTTHTATHSFGAGLHTDDNEDLGW